MQELKQKHLTLGWLLLALAATGGLVLETLHGFKLGFYLDVDQQTRRLLWRLAHAHGALLGLVNVAFAVSLEHMDWPNARRKLASASLGWGSAMLPLGFALGGINAAGGDPGVGIWLVPPGGLLFVAALWLIAMPFFRRKPGRNPGLNEGSASPGETPD